jgi:dipeptidyl aminopeptidase/acylaminoacyl peptidase
LSPDNSQFAFIATVNESGEPYYEDNIFIQSVGEKRPQLLLPDEALEVLDFAWDADGAGLFILGNTGLRTDLYHYGIETRALVRLTIGDHVVDDWTYNPRTEAHTAKFITAQNPGEIYAMSDRDDSFAPLTHEYDDWTDQYRLPRQEAVSWRGRGRATIEGLLVYPLDYDGETPFPLVAITHGGPRSSSQFGSWNPSRYIPVLAAQGYGVLLPNHRGGTGYGDRFLRDMVGGYFTNAHHDVLDGIEALVDRGLADPDQLIKMGWSAGGHMTNKIVTVTDRFKAASSGAGAADWISMYGESDVRHNRTPWFGGAPWEKNAPIRKFRRQSVIQDAWKATTPTLFFVGEKDVRVPPTQSILMYRGLKAAGVETQLYVAAGEPHGYGKPSHRLFKIHTELAWFARHLGRAPYKRVLPPAAYKDDEDAKDNLVQACGGEEASLNAEEPSSDCEVNE